MKRLLTPDRQLVLGRTTAALAFGLISTTLILAVARATGSALDIGLVLACELVPMVLLLPVSGVVADRFRPQRVILAADLLRCAAQFVIACEFLAGRFHILDLSILAGATGIGMAFGMPAGRRLVAATVPPEDRLHVNSRLAVAMGLAMLVAPGIAGTLVLQVGAGWASMTTAALFAVSALTLSRIPSISTAAPLARSSMLADLRDGWVEVRRHPWFLACVQGHGVRHFTTGLLLALGPLIAIDRHGDDSAWVFIAQAGVVGTVLGGYSARRVNFGLPLVACMIGSACIALPLTALALPSPLVVIIVAYFLASAGTGMMTPLWDTTMQRRIPESALGRVGSYDILISLASRPVGLAVAAPLAAWVGASTVLLIGAVLALTANLAVLTLPSVKARYDDTQDGAGLKAGSERVEAVAR